MAALSALILAGRRGPDDPLARAQGVSHRALLEIGGVPMLLRVVAALRAAPGIGALHVSIDEPERLQDVDALARDVASGALVVHRSEDSPSRSVHSVLRESGGAPLLVTTADHALLTPAMLDVMLEASRDTDADVLVGFVAASLLQRAYPQTTRTYLRLRGEAWTGANLFVFRTPHAVRAAEFWGRAERFRKQPWRLLGAIGPDLLVRYALGRLDLDAGLARASRRIGARVRAVPIPIPEAAIDVDRDSDLALATEILAKRAAQAGGSGIPAAGPSATKPPEAGS